MVRDGPRVEVLQMYTADLSKSHVSCIAVNSEVVFKKLLMSAVMVWLLLECGELCVLVCVWLL